MRPRSRYLDLDLYDYFYYLVKQIPEGMVSTYGDLANALGDRFASRAAGEMLFQAPQSEEIPIHRVVFADGSVGNSAHLVERRQRISMLQEEGVRVQGERVLEFDDVRFDRFRTDMPLEKIRKEQVELQKYIEEDGFDNNVTLAAFDVSYSSRRSYGVMVEQKKSGFRISTTIGIARFPYISGYLAYREFPVIRKLFHPGNQMLLIDGNGTLHPRRMGLATFSGILLDSPSIGVAKSKTGLARGEEDLIINNRIEGHQLSNKVIVSPGNRISLNGAMDFYRRNFDSKYPEILRVAHKETVKLRKAKPAA